MNLMSGAVLKPLSAALWFCVACDCVCQSVTAVLAKGNEAVLLFKSGQRQYSKHRDSLTHSLLGAVLRVQVPIVDQMHQA